jgi:hypothetical protein
LASQTFTDRFNKNKKRVYSQQKVFGNEKWMFVTLWEETMMETHERPVTSFILSLIGGLIILIDGILGSIWYLSGNASYGGFWGGMMGGWHGMMGGGFGLSYGYMAGFSLVGLVSGIIVVIGAIMLNVQPADHTSWGIVILIFSIVSFVSMGGFFIGAILGIIGGAFAISWRRR